MRHDLPEQLQALWGKLVDEDSDAGGVAAGPVQRMDQSELDGICAGAEAQRLGARAASGQAQAAPAMSVMTSPRFILSACVLTASCAGLTRASIVFRRMIDRRVKPGDDRFGFTRSPRRRRPAASAAR